MLPLSNAPPKFWKRVSIQTSGCWLWQGNINGWGYGRITAGSRATGDKRAALVHRCAYEWLVGPIPYALCIDHLCRTRHCVNPLHMEPVTLAENVRRGTAGEVNRARMKNISQCPAGHAYNEKNTGVRPNGDRYCRECNEIRRQRNKQ